MCESQPPTIDSWDNNGHRYEITDTFIICTKHPFSLRIPRQLCGIEGELTREAVEARFDSFAPLYMPESALDAE